MGCSFIYQHNNQRQQEKKKDWENILCFPQSFFLFIILPIPAFEATGSRLPICKESRRRGQHRFHPPLSPPFPKHLPRSPLSCAPPWFSAGQSFHRFLQASLSSVSDTAQAARLLECMFHEKKFLIQNDRNLQLYNLDLPVGKMVTAFVENGLEVSEVYACEESLEDYFKRVTGGEGIA